MRRQTVTPEKELKQIEQKQSAPTFEFHIGKLVVHSLAPDAHRYIFGCMAELYTHASVFRTGSAPHGSDRVTATIEGLEMPTNVLVWSGGVQAIELKRELGQSQPFGTAVKLGEFGNPTRDVMDVLHHARLEQIGEQQVGGIVVGACINTYFDHEGVQVMDYSIGGEVSSRRTTIG